MLCQHKSDNRADPFTVAVIKSGVTVGHILRKISSVCFLFLQRSGMIKVCTVERRCYSAYSPQRGLEIHCMIVFEGAGKYDYTCVNLQFTKLEWPVILA